VWQNVKRDLDRGGVERVSRVQRSGNAAGPDGVEGQHGQCGGSAAGGTDAAMSMSTVLVGARRTATRTYSLRIEALVLGGLYVAYELARGVVVGDPDVALEHAHVVVAIEKSVHIFVEPAVQRAIQTVPGLLSVLGGAYLTMHFGVSLGYLLWLHRYRPDLFPRLRTALIVASLISMVGYLVFPTAPPRLAGLGIIDTVSGRHVDLNHGLVHSVYNPFAAVPSMHFGYALIITLLAFRQTRRIAVRVLAVVYPAFVLLVIVATGNHFFFDAVTGGGVAVAAWLIGSAVTRPADASAGSAGVVGEEIAEHERQSSSEGEVEELVRPVGVALRTKHTHDRELGVREPLAQHRHERDGPPFAERG
jgi:hypothetical protein